MDPFRYCTTKTLLAAIVHPFLITDQEIGRIRAWSETLTGPRATAAEAFLEVLGEIGDLRAEPFMSRCDSMMEAGELAESLDWEESAFKPALHAAWRVEQFCEAAEAISAAYLNLRALEALDQGLGREEILALPGLEDWPVRVEVLSRWTWMKEHEAALRRGDQLVAPYSCAVAGPSQVGRGADREYYQLIHFLHGLKIETGRELLPIAKSETPDFLLSEGPAGPVGAEMSEVPISQAWADERDAQARVTRELWPVLAAHQVSVTFEYRTPWMALDASRPALAEWLNSELAKQAKCGAGYTASLREPCSGTRMKVKHRKGPRVWVHSDDGLSGDDLKQAAQDLSDSIRAAVRKKVWKDPSDETKGQRNQPKVKPCHLVLYPNSNIGSTLPDVASALKSSPLPSFGSHFDAVWISSERFIEEIGKERTADGTDFRQAQSSPSQAEQGDAGCAGAG